MNEGPRILGLTGSIGMGKSTVAGMFADAGVPVFDADAAVHRLQGPGGRVVAAIEAAFPGSTGPGGVDRAILGTRVLNDDDAMQRLEGIVHPAVAEERAAFLATHRDAPFVVFDIPLLFETGGDRLVDAIAVVSAAPDVQRARTLARPGMTPAKFDAILARQCPDADKRARADHVIATDVPLDQTRAAVHRVIADMTQAEAIVVPAEAVGGAGGSAFVEHHLVHRTGWLRAAVLGANDGIISVSSLLVGVASAPSATHAGVLLAGTAALVGGALSMAAGEYVSVSSQSDTEQADLARERAELSRAPEQETAELAAIYEGRGVAPALARQVAEQMMAHDALGAHMRDELGLTEELAARPIQAAGSSALSFVAGAAVPVLVAVLAPRASVSLAVSLCALVLLAILGAVGARVGGARIGPAMARVVFWGAIAMGVTGGIGHLLGSAG